jgi:hypothetical protein
VKYVYFLFCVAAGAMIAWSAQPYAHDNSDALLTIVTVMTVLAGFMIAIITVIGEPAMIPDGSWRAVRGRKAAIEAKILRHSYLFVLYLVTIAFIFAGAIIKKMPDNKISCWVPYSIDCAYLFFGSTSFLLSFGLPFSLKKIQLERLELEEKRRLAQAADEKIRL